MPGQERAGKQSSADGNKNKRKIRMAQFLQANAGVMSSFDHCRLYSNCVPSHC
jgi:hypothetical protein